MGRKKTRKTFKIKLDRDHELYQAEVEARGNMENEAAVI